MSQHLPPCDPASPGTSFGTVTDCPLENTVVLRFPKGKLKPETNASSSARSYEGAIRSSTGDAGKPSPLPPRPVTTRNCGPRWPLPVSGPGPALAGEGGIAQWVVRQLGAVAPRLRPLPEQTPRAPRTPVRPARRNDGRIQLDSVYTACMWAVGPSQLFTLFYSEKKSNIFKCINNQLLL